MKIGVLSDTLDQLDQIRWAVTKFNQLKVDLVVHCGDYISPFTLDIYADLTMPMKGVFGNNDGDKFRLALNKAKLELDLFLEDRFLDFEFDGRRIAVFHGDYQGIVEALIKSSTYDAVFHGHTHKPVIETHGQTLSLNPGCLIAYQSPKRPDPSIAVYHSRTNSAELIIFGQN